MNAVLHARGHYLNIRISVKCGEVIQPEARFFSAGNKHTGIFRICSPGSSPYFLYPASYPVLSHAYPDIPFCR